MIKTETICEPAPLRKVATLACILIEPLRENEWTCPSSKPCFSITHQSSTCTQQILTRRSCTPSLLAGRCSNHRYTLLFYLYSNPSPRSPWPHPTQRCARRSNDCWNRRFGLGRLEPIRNGILKF